MGIQGLLPVLRPYMRPGHVKDFAGKKIACDGYSWLHKGVYCCALLVATSQTPWKEQGRRAPYVQYCINRMRMMRSHGVDPVLVFDGDRLPAKSGTELERRARRRERLGRAQELLAQGDSQAAELVFQSAIDVTPHMAYEVICALREEGFEYVVAPYEADAQLAHLARTGQVAAVATEDSDLAAYLAPVILFKMDAVGAVMTLVMADVFAGRLAEDKETEGVIVVEDDDDVVEPGAGAAGGAGADENRAPQDKRDSGKQGSRELSAQQAQAGPQRTQRASAGDADPEADPEAGGAAADSDPDEIEEIVDPEPSAKRSKGSSRKGRRNSGPPGGRELRATAGGGGVGGGSGSGGPAPLSFRKFSPGLFLSMCVLAGCDFLSNIPGIGIKRAHALALKSRVPERLPHLLRLDNKIKLPEGYLVSFRRAISTFKHARIYDAELGALRHLEDAPQEGVAAPAEAAADSSFLGPDLPAEVARSIAEGLIDPMSRQPFPPLPAAAPAPPRASYPSLYGAGAPRAPEGPFTSVGGGSGGSGGYGNGNGNGHWRSHGTSSSGTGFSKSGFGSGRGAGGGGGAAWGHGGHLDLPEIDNDRWGEDEPTKPQDEAALKQSQKLGGAALRHLAGTLGIGVGAGHHQQQQQQQQQQKAASAMQIKESYSGAGLGTFEGFAGPLGMAVEMPVARGQPLHGLGKSPARREAETEADERGARAGGGDDDDFGCGGGFDDDPFLNDPSVWEETDALVAARTSRRSEGASAHGSGGSSGHQRRAVRSPGPERGSPPSRPVGSRSQGAGAGGLRSPARSSGGSGGGGGAKRRLGEVDRGTHSSREGCADGGGGEDEEEDEEEAFLREFETLGEQPSPPRGSPLRRSSPPGRLGALSPSARGGAAGPRRNRSPGGDGNTPEASPGPIVATVEKSRVSWLAAPVALPPQPDRPRPVAPGTLALDAEMKAGAAGKKPRVAAHPPPAAGIAAAALKGVPAVAGATRGVAAGPSSGTGEGPFARKSAAPPAPSSGTLAGRAGERKVVMGVGGGGSSSKGGGSGPAAKGGSGKKQKQQQKAEANQSSLARLWGGGR